MDHEGNDIIIEFDNLAKFLVYDRWRKLIQRFGVKWITGELLTEELIERLTKDAMVMGS